MPATNTKFKRSAAQRLPPCRTMTYSHILYVRDQYTDPPQKVSAYDEDAALSVSTLLSLETCNGRIGATGMCLGGHLAYRCALDTRVSAAVCYFATDIHTGTLGAGGDNSLKRTGEMEGELVMVGRGRTPVNVHLVRRTEELIRRRSSEKRTTTSHQREGT